MKKKDYTQAMEDGATVAVTRWRTQNELPTCDEATVVAVGQSRMERSSGFKGFGPTYEKRDGVHIRYVRTGAEEVVAPTKIISTWARYVSRREDEDARKTTAEDRDAELHALAARIGGANFVRGYRASDPGHYDGIVISRERAEEILAEVRR